MSHDLFTSHGENVSKANAPLAERLRPKNLDDFVGQEGILSEGRLLRRAISADRVGNLLLHGPPGVGKTTLAKIIAHNTRSHFSVLNAALVGIKDIREEVADAKQRLNKYGLRTTVFIDEVHRFNTAQQDALLPWMENGILTLIGATTENPYFEVNKALLSRSRVFRLQSLGENDLRRLLNKALEDTDSGYGNKLIKISNAAVNHLVNFANGDARSLLNALELAVETTIPDVNGLIKIDLAIAEDSIQERAVLYDKKGDTHFDTISAFIKSLRGSDPDASLFWLARMVEAGESPQFIFRRMLIAASEDIGLADPQAIVVVESCASAFERVGLPEGFYPLAQAAIYLASTDKSNSVKGFFEAIQFVREVNSEDIPLHLRDSHRDKETFGDGQGYKYPHAVEENWIPQQYLPKQLQAEVFWKPTKHGWEGKRRFQIFERKAAQLAAVSQSVETNPFILTNGPEIPLFDHWLQKQLDLEEKRLQQQLEKLWSDVNLNRNDRVLILGEKPLFWSLKAMSQVCEGGVSIIISSQEKARLSELLNSLDRLLRPTLITNNSDLFGHLSDDFKFEWVGGRLGNDLSTENEKYNFWNDITSRCTSKTGLRLLVSNLHLGPLGSLLEIVEAEEIKSFDDSFLKEITRLEQNFLNQNKSEKVLIEILKKLRWKINVENWIEDTSFIVDKAIEQRWLSKNSMYRRIILKDISNKEVEKLFYLIRKMQGKRLPQKIFHKKIIGSL